MPNTAFWPTVQRLGVVHVDRDELVVDRGEPVPVGEARLAHERGDLEAGLDRGGVQQIAHGGQRIVRSDTHVRNSRGARWDCATTSSATATCTSWSRPTCGSATSTRPTPTPRRVGLVGDPPRHAGAGQEPRRPAARRHPPVPRRRAQDRLAEAARHRLRRVRGPWLGRRRRRSTPWTPRASTWPCCYPSRGLFVLGIDSVEQIGSDGLEPEFATAIARAYNDWLQGLLRPRARPDVRRRDGRAHDVPRRGGRGPAVRRGARVQGDLPAARGA